jgi:hypothetical protein
MPHQVIWRARLAANDHTHKTHTPITRHTHNHTHPTGARQRHGTASTINTAAVVSRPTKPGVTATPPLLHTDIKTPRSPCHGPRAPRSTTSRSFTSVDKGPPHGYQNSSEPMSWSSRARSTISRSFTSCGDSPSGTSHLPPYSARETSVRQRDISTRGTEVGSARLLRQRICAWYHPRAERPIGTGPDQSHTILL